MNLQSLQTQFQQNILQKNTHIQKHITHPARMTIYQNAYIERMTHALACNFPKLHAALGDAAFRSLCEDYARAYPSTHYNLRFAGEKLSKFILLKDPDFLPYAELAILNIR